MALRGRWKTKALVGQEGWEWAQDTGTEPRCGGGTSTAPPGVIAKLVFPVRAPPRPEPCLGVKAHILALARPDPGLCRLRQEPAGTAGGTFLSWGQQLVRVSGRVAPWSVLTVQAARGW